jgi:hypothetical protein
MSDKLKPTDKLNQRIADLERETRFKDDRIRELKDEIDRNRQVCAGLEEHLQERDEYLETFITAFGLTLDDDGKWGNGEFIRAHSDLVDRFNDLVDRYNKLVRDFNHYAVRPQPVGRPIAASETQQKQIIKHHKAGKSSRWIAEEMTLSRRTVTTVTEKHDGAGRTGNAHRQRLGLEPKRKDWRPASIKRLPRRATEHFEKGRELLKEAKGLNRS